MGGRVKPTKQRTIDEKNINLKIKILVLDLNGSTTKKNLTPYLLSAISAKSGYFLKQSNNVFWLFLINTNFCMII